MTIALLPTNYQNGDTFSATDVNNITTTVNTLSASQSLIAAKGDILTGASDDTLGKTSVGANNTVLYADSTATYGVAWGQVTSAMITDGTIVNGDISASAAIAYSKLALTGAIVNADLAGSITDTKLSTISTAGKVANSATTATSANTANAIVARDASGNFGAATITANTCLVAYGTYSAGGGGYYYNSIQAGGFPSDTSNGIIRVGAGTNSATCITTNGYNATTNYHLTFHYSNTTVVGSITSSSTTTSYNTTSDYRLKTELGPIIGALAKLAQLRPIRFEFNAAPGEVHDGFIAHEVDEIVPTAVSGEKDAIDEEGNIKPQQLDHSKLVPLLVAAVQELTQRVDALAGA